jgi:hypothetical protein
VLIIGRLGGLVARIGRPSTARYEALIRELSVSQFNLESGKHDALAIGEYALASVIEFLNADPSVMDSGITNSLSIILNALHDCRRGARPPLFFDRPRSSGRPTDQTFDAVKAAAAMGIEVLLAARVKRSEAGRYVAGEARKLGLRRPDQKQISGRAVLGWHERIETAESEIGAEVFKQLKGARATRKPITDPKQAQALAREFLVQARFAGFVVTL